MAADELEVRLAGRRIGILSRTRKGARFRYDDDAVVAYAGRPLLSAALPVKARPYAEGLTGAWFSGLLPEGDRFDYLCRRIDCAPSDYMSILAEIGWECAGAVSIAEAGFEAPAPAQNPVLIEDELAAKLNSLPSFFQEGQSLPRVSLGGYQDKLCVVGHNINIAKGRVDIGAFSLPDETEVSTHILKPQPAGKYPHLIESEAWAMAAASWAARCARVALLELDGVPPVLCVERFDRKEESGNLRRIHQEDCCQALGLSPKDKYVPVKSPLGTDPSYRKIAALLSRFAENADIESAELLRQMTANLILGNTDAHAKNYALLYQVECIPTISPMYDVAPVFLVEPKAAHLSMRINGKILLDDVTPEDLVLEGASWGIPGLDARMVVAKAATDLLRGIGEADSRYPTAGERYSTTVTKRAKSVIARL